MLFLFLAFLLSAGNASVVTSANGNYCADTSLQKNWFDAELYCNNHFGGFSSFHSAAEFNELESFSLSMNYISWNGAYEVEASDEILFSDGSPYDYAVQISNQNLGTDEYGMIWSSEQGLTLGLNPNFVTYFVCNCENAAPSPSSGDDMCPDSCEGISYDGCNRCMCRKNGKHTCTNRDCEPTMERTCLYTEIVRQACPEGCAKYDMGGRKCLCKQKQGYMICEPEGHLHWDLKPQCIETIQEMEADFNGNLSSNVFVTFASQHWFFSSILAVALIAAIIVFFMSHHTKLCANKGEEYQSLL